MTLHSCSIYLGAIWYLYIAPLCQAQKMALVDFVTSNKNELQDVPRFSLIPTCRHFLSPGAGTKVGIRNLLPCVITNAWERFFFRTKEPEEYHWGWRKTVGDQLVFVWTMIKRRLTCSNAFKISSAPKSLGYVFAILQKDSAFEIQAKCFLALLEKDTATLGPAGYKGRLGWKPALRLTLIAHAIEYEGKNGDVVYIRSNAKHLLDTLHRPRHFFKKPIFSHWIVKSDILKGTAATAVKSLQSCPTLCDPIAGILQARTLDWVALQLHILFCYWKSWYVAYWSPRFID